jgi:alanine racemase
MPQYTLQHIAEITKGTLHGNKEESIRHIASDSRSLTSGEHSLFIAIKGIRHDGHTFIEELIKKKKYCNFLVDYIPTEIVDRKVINFITVEDTLQALQILTSHHRLQCSCPIIGITGSNGKTIVKEWLYQLLHVDKVIVRSPKSFNSQIGVPLSVWNLEANTQLGIFEAGISLPDEMEKLERIIKPEIGLFTNIGAPHQENFESLQQKANEKIKLFINCKTFFYCKDYKEIDNSVNEFIKNAKIVCWSKKTPCDLFISKIEKSGANTCIKGIYANENLIIEIPFTDEASIENAIHCWLMMLHMGYANETIANRMQHLLPVAMRIELKKGINNCTLINDSYNSDIQSLSIALDFLNQQQQHQIKTVILSDIFQSGYSETVLYKEISELLKTKKIHKFIGVGESLYQFAHLFEGEKYFFYSTEELIAQLPKLNFTNEGILIKGSRSFGFEKLSTVLEQKLHQTVMEVNMNALIHNLNYFRSKLKPETKIMVMVKAFSYGSGSYEIANMLEYQKVDYLAVAFADEGVALRKAGIGIPIVVMNPEDTTFKLMIENDLEPQIYSFKQFDHFIEVLNNLQINSYPIHLKLDSGMHRLGFDMSEIEKLNCILSANQQVVVKSVFSHLAAADEEALDNFTKEQFANFEIMSSKIIQLLKYPVIRHILNSSGIERFTEKQYEMVRLGIGMYGVNDSCQNQLQNVSKLKTTISQIKHIKKGETVGYGRKGKAIENTTIGIIPIGYADGFSRRLSNGIGQVFVIGKRVPIIGNICMDMCMINITGINVNEGDEVEIFGENITLNEIAHTMGTIPYEVLTGISNRVKRVYIQE